MASNVVGRARVGGWEGERAEDGRRTYRRTFFTRAEPGVPLEDHLAAPGLPAEGDVFRADRGLTDQFAFCLGLAGPPLDVSSYRESAYRLTFLYSTFPPEGPPAADEPVFVG